jgi:hypothetical protein
MKNYVGKKIIGFQFESTDYHIWHDYKAKHIGEVGEITIQYESSVMVKFKDDSWLFPIHLIEAHIVTKTNPLVL